MCWYSSNYVLDSIVTSSSTVSWDLVERRVHLLTLISELHAFLSKFLELNPYKPTYCVIYISLSYYGLPAASVCDFHYRAKIDTANEL
jgi:hypothetical protein